MSILQLKMHFDSYFDFHFGLAGIICVLIFGAYLWIRRKNLSSRIVLDGVIFSIYITFLLGGTLLGRSIGESHGVEWKIFWSYKRVFVDKVDALAWQIFYNVLIFIPWGIIFPQVWSPMQKMGRVMLSALGFSLCIELTQLILKCGWFEFDDIFHNTLGATIGYGIWKLFYTLRRKRTHE